MTRIRGVGAVQTIVAGTKGLGLLVQLNWDRILYIATILLALGAGAYVGTVNQ